MRRQASKAGDEIDESGDRGRRDRAHNEKRELSLGGKRAGDDQARFPRHERSGRLAGNKEKRSG